MLGRSGDVASILQDATPSPRRSPGILKDRLAAWIWQGGFGQVDLVDSTKNPAARNTDHIKY
jgi:hypothetical protein